MSISHLPNSIQGGYRPLGLGTTWAPFPLFIIPEFAFSCAFLKSSTSFSVTPAKKKGNLTQVKEGGSSMERPSHLLFAKAFAVVIG